MPISFETLRQAFDRVKQERSDELRTKAPELSDPSEIYMKRLQDSDTHMVVQFAGFESAVDDDKAAAQVKRLILIWLRSIFVNVQQARSDPDSMIVKLDKETRASFGEAAISIFKRDPKTNKRKNYYRCIGGKKNGRRVSSPDDCMGVPDPMKKIKFGITKRAKPGQAQLGKKKTQLTNILAKKIRKANQRLKKARGF